MGNRAKNILFITNLHMWSMAQNKGGRAFITTIESYINAGWHLAIVSTGGGIPDYVRNNAICYEDNYPRLDNLTKSPIKIVRLLSRIVKSIACTNFYLKKGKALYETNFLTNGVIYAYEIEGVHAAKLLAKRYHRPLITRFQGTIIAPIRNNLKNRIRYYPHFQALSTPADLIIMTNDGTQGLKTLKRLHNESPVRFWMNGVSIPPKIDDERRKMARIKCGVKDDFVFLTVSRLVGWKRVDRAIEAFSRIKESIPRSSLHIIGDGAAKESLMKFAKDKCIEDKVIFHGAIEQTQVFDYIIASDVFLSLYDLSNVGNPLLEAMSCGKTIITLDNGDTSMFIKDMENGIILSERDVEKVSDKMFFLYENNNLAKKLGDAAREFAEKHFWGWDERMEKELQDVNNMLLDI